MQCQMFTLCVNEATTTVPNPVRGDVPSCQRCKDKMKALDKQMRERSITYKRAHGLPLSLPPNIKTQRSK